MEMAKSESLFTQNQVPFSWLNIPARTERPLRTWLDATQAPRRDSGSRRDQRLGWGSRLLSSGKTMTGSYSRASSGVIWA